MLRFLSRLPIGLERADLRVVHAAWQPEQIEIARTFPLGSVRQHYDQWELAAKQEALETELEQHIAAELERWEHGLENPHRQPPFLHAHAQFESNKRKRPANTLLKRG